VHTYELLNITAAVVPDRIAVIFDEWKTRYSDLNNRVNRVANGLRSLGVEAGDRVAVIDVNSPEQLEILFALLKLDAVYVPLNFRGRMEDISYAFGVATPKAIVAGERYIDLIERVEQSGRSFPRAYVSFGQTHMSGWISYQQLLNSRSDYEIISPVGDSSGVMSLLFTAGTTGSPKAVPLSHNSFTSFMLANVDPADPMVEENTLLTLPMYHIAGLQAALASIYGGRTMVIQRQFDAEEWLTLVQSHKVQRALVVPTMLKQIMDHPEFETSDLSSVRVITYGGASMPPPVIERAIRSLPGVQFINAFGQTETGSTIAMVPPEDHILEGPREIVDIRRKHLSSIGIPLPDVEVVIMGPSGELLPPGHVGEIAVRGPRLMQGYLSAEGAQLTDEMPNGWHRTGDLGYREDDGYIYLEGRAKDFIKRGGEMVSPERVENVLYGYHGIDECAVIGIPDEEWGEKVLAIVVQGGSDEISERSILDFCNARLARFERPEGVIFVDSLPHNSLGKVIKHELRHKFQIGDG
jgi:acyl-CoA synthetase (AMP-forming)/AMP-acid ligase II